MNERTALFCLKAVRLPLLALLLLVLVAHAKTACEFPPVPDWPDSYGFRAVEISDQLQQHWIYLFVRFNYGQETLETTYARFEPNEMIKAVKEGMKWNACIKKKFKAISPKSVHVESYR